MDLLSDLNELYVSNLESQYAANVLLICFEASSFIRGDQDLSPWYTLLIGEILIGAG